jgi:hypothetical protein
MTKQLELFDQATPTPPSPPAAEPKVVRRRIKFLALDDRARAAQPCQGEVMTGINMGA